MAHKKDGVKNVQKNCSHGLWMIPTAKSSTYLFILVIISDSGFGNLRRIFYTYFRRAVVEIGKLREGACAIVPISMFHLFGKILNGNKIQNSINAFTVLYY